MKVRGSKVAEFNHLGAQFAVIKMADAEEGEFVTPGSDQADAVLRLEAMARVLKCDFNRIEQNIETLLMIEKDHNHPALADEYVDQAIKLGEDAPNIRDVFANAEPPAPPDDIVNLISEMIDIAEDLGLQPVVVVGSAEEMEKFLK